MNKDNLLTELPNAFNRKSLVEGFDGACTTINNEVIPSIDDMVVYTKDNNITMEDVKELGVFTTLSGIKANSPDHLFKSLNITMKKMIDKQKDINKFILKTLPDIITKENITVKQLALMEIIDSYNTVCTYTIDLLLYTTEIIKKSLYGSEMTMIPNKITEVRSSMSKYAMMINYLYHNVDRVIVDLNKMDSTLVNPEGKDKGILASISKVKNFLKPTSFIGNPIYHVRMWLVDFQLYRYDIYADKRKMLQLKIQELESMKNGENNKSINKRIEYYNDKLESVEYKIRELEVE